MLTCCSLFFHSAEKPYVDAQVRDSLPDPAFVSKIYVILVRERDTTSQLIGSVEDVLNVVCTLVRGDMNWEDASAQLKVYDGVQAVD